MFDKPSKDDVLRALAVVTANACEIAANDRRRVIGYFGQTVHLDPKFPRHLAEALDETHDRWVTEAIEVLARYLGQVDATPKDMTAWVRPLLQKMSTTMLAEMAHEAHGSTGAICADRKVVFDRRVEHALREFELGRINGADIEVEARAATASVAPPTPNGPSYVSSERLQALRAIKSSEFDLTKLIRLCEELNSNYSAGNYFSVAMLVRAILDHVPPIFSATKFEDVRAKHGGRSFKEQMDHLDKSYRKIADEFLHGQVRRKEVLPTGTVIHFAPALDILLGEVAAKLH